MALEYWEHFRHDADIGVRGFGPTLSLAFVQAALATTAVITDPAWVSPEESIPVSCEAPDDELLLTEWLNVVIREMDIRKMLFSRFQVDISNHSLHAVLWGEKVNPQRHHPAVEIKGATYTELRVQPAGVDRWLAQCVVDV